jgi:peptidoglycan/LPS O-acetylase OafA/YrhL
MDGRVLDTKARRYDIDWLRIAAVLLLIPFHTARVFNVGERFYAKNEQLSTALQRFIVFVGPWHMSLLFVLAGAASWFALGYRSGGRYAAERLKRLMAPFLFGLVVIIPPQAYFGMLTNTGADRSWWAQYSYFWTHWENPDNYVGWWTPGHLWFILFLFVYALLAVGLFVWMRRGGGHRIIGWFAAACRIPGMVIVVPAVLLLAQQALVPMDDISGQSPVGFFLLFLIGFVMVADERVTAAVDRQWWWALALGVAAMVARAALWPGSEDYPDPSWQDSVVNWLGYQVGLWMVIVGLMGLFHRYAQRKGRAYAYATEAAYPFYILHQTVIVLIAYGVVQWGVGIPLKFTLIAAASFALTVAVYEVAIRRWGFVRPLFGMKPRRRRTS